jgi:hypothetical protein
MTSEKNKIESFNQKLDGNYISDLKFEPKKKQAFHLIGKI